MASFCVLPLRMTPVRIGSPMPAFVPTKRLPVCSDPSILPSNAAPQSVKDLWWLHGHPHSRRYSNPKLVSLTALVRDSGAVYRGRPGFLYPDTAEPLTSYKSLTWDDFDRITESLAAIYAHELLWELQEANRTREQPTVALLGRGTTLEYFCTQLALQKLGVRVLLLAESNSVTALHHLLSSCNVLAVITDRKNASADIKHVRRVEMIEDLPRNVTVQQANVDAIKFQDSGDVWEQHTFILHTSGSTGLPKPIIHTNRSLMLIARMYRLFPDFDVKNWFLLFPLYHIAGLSIALSGLPNGRILSFPPLSWPPSSSSLLASWQTLSQMSYPVDVVHCAPTLIENMYEYITDTGNDYTALSSLKVLQPGGAALSANIIKTLVANGVNVKTTYGSTEIGPPFRTIPHTRDNPKCYSFRTLYPDNDKIKMENVGGGLYECVVYKGFDLAANLWSKNDEPYRTNDLFVQDPPGSGFYVMQGRKDDILIHSNGENTSGGSLQSDIQASSKIIRRALAVGHSKPCVGLLIELSDGKDPTDEKTRQQVIDAVEEVNDRYAAHSRVPRCMVYILPRGQTLPVTPKGNVRRKEAEQTFAKVITQLYSSLEGASHNITINPLEPLEDYVRNAYAEVAGVSKDSVHDWTSIYDLGIDSHLALYLRSSLSKRLGPISLSNIFEYPSPSKLLHFLKTKSRNAKSPRPDQSQVISHLLSKLTSEFQTWPARSPNPALPHPEAETILLTGATGTLGTSLLRSLSSSPRVSKIYALIRGPNHRIKLHQALISKGHDSNAILNNGKIEILNYSMQDPLLGLNIEEYAKLASTVTIVLHNAWKMDFNLGVENFVDDCLRGTLSLLRLAHSGAPKTFAFTSSMATSTLSAFGSTTLTKSAATSTPLNPLQNSNDNHFLTGYALSKYLTESLLSSFAEHLHTPITVLRLGQLCGHSSTGAWNECEMWPILFKTSMKLGALPILDDSNMEMGNLGNIDWLPVDVAANVIAEVLLHENGPANEHEKSTNRESRAYKEFNIVNPKSLPWTEALGMLQRVLPSGGESMKEISLGEWVRLLNEAGDDGAQVDEMPGLRLLPFFERMVTEDSALEAIEMNGRVNISDLAERKRTEANTVFDTTNTRALSSSLRACRPFSEDWIRRSVEWWRKTGFMG